MNEALKKLRRAARPTLYGTVLLLAAACSSNVEASEPPQSHSIDRSDLTLTVNRDNEQLLRATEDMSQAEAFAYGIGLAVGCNPELGSEFGWPHDPEASDALVAFTQENPEVLQGLQQGLDRARQSRLIGAEVCTFDLTGL